MVDWQFWSLNFPTDHGGAVTRAARVKAFPTSVRLWITSHAASTDNHGDGHQSGMVLYGGADPPFRGLGDLARQSCNAHECLICFITPNFNRLQCKSVLVAFINSTSVSRSGCKGSLDIGWLGWDGVNEHEQGRTLRNNASLCSHSPHIEQTVDLNQSNPAGNFAEDGQPRLPVPITITKPPFLFNTQIWLTFYRHRLSILPLWCPDVRSHRYLAHTNVWLLLVAIRCWSPVLTGGLLPA